VTYFKALSRNLIGETTTLLRRSKYELATSEMQGTEAENKKCMQNLGRKTTHTLATWTKQKETVSSKYDTKF
jgi:hypothetical protein